MTDRDKTDDDEKSGTRIVDSGDVTIVPPEEVEAAIEDGEFSPPIPYRRRARIEEREEASEKR